VSLKLEDFFKAHPVDKPTPSIEKKSEPISSPDIPKDLPESHIVGVGYDGEKRQAFLKLYEPNQRRIFFWYDDTGHKPYCLAQGPIQTLETNQSIMKHPGFERLEQVRKYDALRDETVDLVRIVAKDPLTIGGKPSGSIRDLIKAWEADIKYVENYIYDRAICPGMPYRVEGGKLVRVDYKLPSNVVNSIEKLLSKESEEYRRLALEWIRLLECPVPEFYRASLDIEVFQDVTTRIPDPALAEQPVICASMVDTTGKKHLFLLKRTDADENVDSLPRDADVEYFEREEDLLAELFKMMVTYPIIVTFNGDDFDFRYLWNRAQRKGFDRKDIPIEMGRETATIKNGIHIDLYKFFFNRSIQVYAFGQKYRENTLDEIGLALLGVGKKEIEKTVTQLSYGELASYCLRDAEITLGLTTFKDDLVMKLIAALSRIGFMSFEDVSRQGVSNWIRSTLYNEHRRRNFLIPRSDDIIALKGVTSTEAVIKGKKYKGAIVVEPVPGIHFGVAVLDFASLYPSIIKVWNLGYETILCQHKDSACRENKVPGTPHWVCKKNRALESLLIGSLRDLRVNWYKPRSKDKALPEDVKSLYGVIQNALKVVLNACFIADTEILTPSGGRKITDLKVGDEIYTLNKKSGTVEVKPVIECQHFVYDGPLVEICSRYVDWKVTGNHDLYLGRSVKEGGRSTVHFSKSKALLEAHQRTRRYLFRHMALDSATDGGSYERVSLWDHIPNAERLICIIPNRAWDRRFSQSSRFYHYPFAPELERNKGGRYYRTTKELIESVAGSSKRFEDLYDCRLQVRNFEEHGSRGPWSFDPTALFELIGWYVSEGSVQIGKNKRGFRFARVTIAQHPRHRSSRKRIISTIKMLGLTPRVWLNGVAFSSRVMIEFFRKECGTKSFEKHLPQFIFYAPFELRKRLFDTLMLGDGNIERGYYSTVSEKLAKDFQHLAFTLGIESLIRTESICGRNQIYRIKLFRRNHHVIYGNNFRITPTKRLDVYCVTAQDNHVVYAGRNGKFGWIGQSYGVFGSDRFALYCPPVAEATAAIGRYAITNTIEKARSIGMNVVYGDTDSIFLGNPSPEQLNGLIEWSRDFLEMELEVDKRYRYLVLSSRKKNYLGVLPDGSVDIKGLTGKKRHVPEFLKRAFYEMIEILSKVQSVEEFEDAKVKIKAIVKNCYLMLRDRRFSLQDLAFNVMISKAPDDYRKTTPQHVKAAELLSDRGVEVKAGDLISFVKVTTEVGVKPVQVASPEEVDVRKYIEYLDSTFEQVLDALGTDFHEIVGTKKLDSFFKGD
jgi:DNA polymerase elongation subunit (family B)